MVYKEPNIIEFAKICDPRGNLSVIESCHDVPFEVKRTYWIYDVPGGKYRNGHAFRKQHEVIVALSGSFDIVVNDGKTETRHHMARSYYGLYIPPMTWRRIDNFSTNSVVLVLSSECYDENDYIEDFNEFEAIMRNGSESEYVPDSLAPMHPIEASRHDTTNAHATSSIKNCALLNLPRHHHNNGNLTVVEGYNPCPFNINRIFYLYDIPGGADRGGHSHLKLQQLIIAISGSFDIEIDDGVSRRSVTLNRPYQGLLIPPGIWNRLGNFSSGAVCLVIASQGYEEEDYVRNYDEFLKLTSAKRTNE